MSRLILNRTVLPSAGAVTEPADELEVGPLAGVEVMVLDDGKVELLLIGQGGEVVVAEVEATELRDAVAGC